VFHDHQDFGLSKAPDAFPERNLIGVLIGIGSNEWVLLGLMVVHAVELPDSQR